MATILVGRGELKLPSQAFKIARDGDKIQIEAGQYNDVAYIKQKNLFVQGVGGAVNIFANGQNAQGKGTWVVDGADLHVENLNFFNARVPDQNGAGLRLQAPGLYLLGCGFYGNENGILTDNPGAGEIHIEWCDFAYNGFGDGRTHNMYIGDVGKLIVRDTYSRYSKVGHLVKSRAKVTVLEGNRLFEGTASYAVDIPYGGDLVMRRNVLWQNNDTDNNGLVAYGAEGLKNPGREVIIEYNTIVNEARGVPIVINGENVRVVMRRNILITPGTLANRTDLRMEENFSRDPGFVNPKKLDFRLRAGSPAQAFGAFAPAIASGRRNRVDPPAIPKIKEPPPPPVIKPNPVPLPPLSLDERQQVGAEFFAQLKQGVWYEIPNTRLDAVAPPQIGIIRGVEGPSAVYNDWNGACLDTRRNAIVIPACGGHEGYAGNEVYELDFDKFKLSRIVDPTPSAQISRGGNPETYLDGRPRSRHTYGSPVYAANRDVVIISGGSLFPSGGASSLLWMLDRKTKQWLPPVSMGMSSLSDYSVYDPKSGHVFIKHAGGPQAVAVFDPMEAKFVGWHTDGVDPGFYVVTTLVEELRAMAIFGRLMGDSVSLGYFNLDTKKEQRQALKATDEISAELNKLYYPGFVYHPKLKRLVLFNGGAWMYLVDPLSLKVEKIQTSGALPSAPVNGTFGRMQYLTKHNVIAFGALTHQNWWMLRL